MKIDFDFAVSNFKSLSYGEVFMYKDEDESAILMKINPCGGCINDSACIANAIDFEDSVLYHIDEDDPVYPMEARLILQYKEL